jgi:hypothetical protein
LVVTKFVAALVLFVPMPFQADDSASGVEVKVTQKHLVPVWLDGRKVDAGERVWRLVPGSHALAFTMHNAPRHALAEADVPPGIAVVRFVLDDGDSPLPRRDTPTSCSGREA